MTADAAGELDRLGLALWTMQSTAARPGLHRSLYRRFGEDVRLADRLGFRAVWLGEHRVWYDGWCPAPLHALAYAAGLTERIGLGTAMYLAPQHDARAAAETIATLDELSGGRVELGAGLGYRDPEFDALGLRRDRRGRLIESMLDELEAIWAGARRCAAGTPDGAADLDGRHGARGDRARPGAATGSAAADAPRRRAAQDRRRLPLAGGPARPDRDAARGVDRRGRAGTPSASAFT
jgi:alkanesulfonate monooxygenase SsuD/methylene tetrahydromethanopterin reductase-like flavin-dependent oxidoreductase (luciferase family)